MSIFFFSVFLLSDSAIPKRHWLDRHYFGVVLYRKKQNKKDLLISGDRERAIVETIKFMFFFFLFQQRLFWLKEAPVDVVVGRTDLLDSCLIAYFTHFPIARPIRCILLLHCAISQTRNEKKSFLNQSPNHRKKKKENDAMTKLQTRGGGHTALQLQYI